MESQTIVHPQLMLSSNCLKLYTRQVGKKLKHLNIFVRVSIYTFFLNDVFYLKYTFLFLYILQIFKLFVIVMHLENLFLYSSIIFNV